jgi:hypothetical protein
MEKRKLSDLMPAGIFRTGSPNQKFIKQPNPVVDIDLNSIPINDRSVSASAVFEDYFIQAAICLCVNSYDDTNKSDIYKVALNWLSERFTYDKAHHLEPSAELTKFYNVVMARLVDIVDYVGAEAFVNLIYSHNLQDIACICESDGTYMDLLALLVKRKKNGVVYYLIFNGFEPKNPGYIPFIFFKYPLVNTTTICYMLDDPFAAALLERSGFAATETRQSELLRLRGPDITWLTDISLYQGEQHSSFRALYVGAVCDALIAVPTLDNKLDLSNLEKLFSTLSIADISRSLPSSSTYSIRAVLVELLSEKISVIRDGAFDDNIHALPKWLTISPDNPFILAKESNEHRKLVLNYNDRKYVQLIMELSESGFNSLDAYVIDSATGKLMSINKLPSLAFNPIN